MEFTHGVIEAFRGRGEGQEIRNPTEAAYARSDLFELRWRLMDDWDDYLNAYFHLPL